MGRLNSINVVVTQTHAPTTGFHQPDSIICGYVPLLLMQKMLQSLCGNIRIAIADLGEESPSQIETRLKDMNDLLIQCKAPTVMERKDTTVRDWLSDQDISAGMEYIYEKAGVSTTTKPARLKWKMRSKLAMGESESIYDLTTSDN